MIIFNLVQQNATQSNLEAQQGFALERDRKQQQQGNLIRFFWASKALISASKLYIQQGCLQICFTLCDAFLRA